MARQELDPGSSLSTSQQLVFLSLLVLVQVCVAQPWEILEETCSRVTDCTIKPNLPCQINHNCDDFDEIFGNDSGNIDSILSVETIFKREHDRCQAHLNISWFTPHFNECFGGPLKYLLTLHYISPETGREHYVLFDLQDANWSEDDLQEEIMYSYNCFQPLPGQYSIDLSMYYYDYCDESYGWISTGPPWEIIIPLNGPCPTMLPLLQSTVPGNILPLPDDPTPVPQMPRWTMAVMALAFTIVITIVAIIIVVFRPKRPLQTGTAGSRASGMDREDYIRNRMCAMCAQRRQNFISPGTSMEQLYDEDDWCDHTRHFIPPQEFEDHTVHTRHFISLPPQEFEDDKESLIPSTSRYIELDQA